MFDQFHFRRPGNSVSCATFDIIDDVIALEESETFAVEVAPVAGPVEIGRKNRTTITIEDDDGMYRSHWMNCTVKYHLLNLLLHLFMFPHNIVVVRIRPSTENEIVFESDGTVQVCLVKDKDTAHPLQVNVIVGETVTSDNPATGMVIRIISMTKIIPFLTKTYSWVRFHSINLFYHIRRTGS